MKIFKNKSKTLKNLYSNIRLFDVIVVLTLAAIAILLFMFLARKAEYLNVTIKVGDDSIVWPHDGVPAWYVNQLAAGMAEKDLVGRENAQVLKVNTYFVEPNKKILYVDLKIRVVYSSSAQSYTFNSRPVLIGNTLRVNPGNVLLEGMVVNIEGIKDPRQKETLRFQTQVFGNDPVFPNTTGVYDYIADAIHVGDEVKDSSGNTLIKIIDKQVAPAKRVVVTNNGTSFLTQDPFKKDLYVTVDVNATKLGSDYYLFDQLKLNTNVTIPIQLQNITVYGTITKKL